MKWLTLAPVDKAWKLGREKCHIVIFDWLEECLIRKNKRYRSERYWTLENTLNRVEQKKKDVVKYERKFIDGVNASEEFVGQSKLTFPVRIRTRSGSSH
jgi:hypothetical protein